MFLKPHCPWPFFVGHSQSALPLRLGSLPSSGQGASCDTKRSRKVVSLRVEVSWSRCEWDFSLSAGNQASPACGQAAPLPEEERGCPRLHPPLLRPFCYRRSPEWLCLSQQPAFHGRAGGRKDPVERNGEGRTRDPLARGILSASALILWIVHPSAHCEDGEAECPTAVQ